MNDFHIWYINIFQHPPVDDLEYDVEIVSLEEKHKSIPETCNNDVIALSDDEVSIKDDNYEMNIKVFWRSNRIDRLNMRRVCMLIISL